MDTRTGKILTEEELKKVRQEEMRFIKQMQTEPTRRQRRRMKVGRNDPCPCNSGKKFKKCCLNRKGIG